MRNNFFKNNTASIVAGFGAGVLLITPLIKNFCCIVIPAAAVFSLILEQKATNGQALEIKRSALLGLYTGIFSAVFGTAFEILITYITHTNDLVKSVYDLQQFWNSIKSPMIEQSVELLTDIAEKIKTSGFSGLYVAIVMFNNFIFNSLFGLLGGLLGYKLLNRNN